MHVNLLYNTFKTQSRGVYQRHFIMSSTLLVIWGFDDGCRQVGKCDEQIINWLL